jgi:beta-glucanase (GH16 family)
VPARDYVSGELRTKGKYGPYGKISVRMKAPNRPGFISSLFSFRTRKADQWHEIDMELTGRLKTAMDTNLITTWAGSGCTTYNCTQNSHATVYIPGYYIYDYHTYVIDWRSQSIEWFVDGVSRRKVYRSSFTGAAWPDRPTELMMNHWLPQHSIQTSFGGSWTDADLPHYAEYDWFRFEKCTSGC